MCRPPGPAPPHLQISCTISSLCSALRWMSLILEKSPSIVALAAPRSCRARPPLLDWARTAARISVSTRATCMQAGQRSELGHEVLASLRQGGLAAL